MGYRSIMKNLVIGESLIDVAERADGSSARSPGGSPLNVAVGLGRLGHDVDFVTDLGGDDDATAILSHLQCSNVTIHALGTGRTSTARAVLAGDGTARYDFALRWDPQVDDEVIARSRWDAVHIGSISAFLSPGAAVVDRLLARCSAPGTIRVFDPNIRPSVIGVRSAALERVEHLIAQTDVLKLSDVDADWLLPDTGIDEQIDRFLDLGARFVALTRGARGAVLATASARVAVDAPATEVNDTIGAGDSFTAALIDGLGTITGVDRPHALRHRWADMDAVALTRLGGHAVRAAALTVSRKGADPPWAGELRADAPAALPESTPRRSI